MTIEEFYRTGKISTRAYNICKRNNLNSVKDIKEHYFKNNSFKDLKNCGKKSNEELINICSTPQKNISNKKEEEFKKAVANLNKAEKEALNNFILTNINKLSVRSRNGISLYLEKDFRIEKFIEKELFSNHFKIREIKNIGAKSIPELENYLLEIENFVKKVKFDDENHLKLLKNKFLIQRHFSIKNIPPEILETESIFLIINFLLEKNVFFDESKTIILKKSLKIYQNQEEMTLEYIAEKVNLTRERVRQIRKKCLEELLGKLLFVKKFGEDITQKYSIDINPNQIEINEDIIDKINKTNNTNFSKGFITYVLYAYLSDDFVLIGKKEDILQVKYFNIRNRYNWKNFYIISKKVAHKVNFNALTYNIYNRLNNNRIEKTYHLNFTEYVSNFTNNNLENFDKILPIAKKIINTEFDLHINLKGNISFKRNTIKKVYEYAFEALESLGKPSKVSEIFKKVIELYPNYNTDETKVRVSMKRRDGFVPIGRKSIFGLKKWENELDGFKGGTIRDIAKDYLLTKNSPVHILELTNYISKFRPKTYQRSIIDNLKSDNSNEFIFFNQGFIGVSVKKSDYNFTKYKNLPIQLGKKIISLYKKGYSINKIKNFLITKYNLNDNESKNIIYNLQFFQKKQ